MVIATLRNSSTHSSLHQFNDTYTCSERDHGVRQFSSMNADNEPKDRSRGTPRMAPITRQKGMIPWFTLRVKSAPGISGNVPKKGREGETSSRFWQSLLTRHQIANPLSLQHLYAPFMLIACFKGGVKQEKWLEGRSRRSCGVRIRGGSQPARKLLGSAELGGSGDCRQRTMPAAQRSAFRGCYEPRRLSNEFSMHLASIRFYVVCTIPNLCPDPF